MLFCISIALKAFVEFGYRLSETYEYAEFWWHIDIFWPFSTPFLLHFVLAYIEKTKIIKSIFFYLLLYGPATLLFVFEVFTDIVTGPPVKTEWGYSYGKPSNTFFLFSSSAMYL